MASQGSDDPLDFEALARQYWGAWGSVLREGAAQPPGGEAQAGAGEQWRQAMDWWNTLLQDKVDDGARDAMHRFRGPAGDWLATMQKVAAQFAGRDTSSAEVARAWRRAVEAQEGHWLQWMTGATEQAGSPGWDPALEQISQWLERWRRDNAPWLGMPGFGLGRNQHERWQRLAQAQQQYQAQAQEYARQLRSAIEQAFSLFEQKLSEHEAPGEQLTSARAMFDLWIDAAEEAYAGVAMSEEFQRIYAGFAEAQMRLRGAIQQEIEQLSERLGMPTRSEMDAAHRRIAELERLLRRMAAAQDAAAKQAPAVPRKAAPSARRPAKKTAPATAGRKAAAAAPRTSTEKKKPAGRGRSRP